MSDRSRGRRLLGMTMTSLLAGVGVFGVGTVAANAQETPSVNLTVTEVPEQRVDIQISGTGFGDVPALPGQAEPHAYFMLVEQGSDLSEVSETDTAISASITASGTLQDTLSVPASQLVEGSAYDLISWPSRSFPSDANLYLREAVTIDWAALFPAPEPEPQVPSVTTTVTVIPEEGIDVAISGTGFGDVPALPGQAEPHAYFMLIERGSDLADVSQTDSAISATIDADGNISDTLSVPASELDANSEYDLISWPSRSFPTENNLYVREAITIDWEALFPGGEQQTPRVTLSVTEVANERVDIAISGTGFGDVQAQPGQTAPSVYFMLVERGADLADVNEADDAVSATVDAEGNITADLSVSAGQLDAEKQYDLISWPSRSFPTDDNLFTRDRVAIDWAALFPQEEVDGWQLVWGVKESFRNYVTGRIANGSIATSGDVSQASGNGQFSWTNGQELESVNGTQVQFSGTVTFRGHGDILFLEIINPRVVVNGNGDGAIYADVRSKEFIDTETEGAIQTFENVRLVTFSGGDWATPNADTRTFEVGRTLLTADAAEAFGGFFSVDEGFDGFTLNSVTQEVPGGGDNNGGGNNGGDNNGGNTGDDIEGGAESEVCLAYEVSGNLNWALKDSFVSYIQGGIAQGEITTSGVQFSGGSFTWSGSGQLNTNAMLGQVSFPGTVQFSGHDGVLDTRISNIQLVIHSASQASIYADVVSNDLEGNSTSLSGVRFAVLNISGASLTSGSFSVSGAGATLTADGARAFAGFYESGETLAPVSFSLSLGNEVACNDAVNPSGEGLANTGFDSPTLAIVALAVLLMALGARSVAVAQRRRQ